MDYMTHLLDLEGFRGEGIGIKTCANFKTDVGFFCVRIEHGYPFLVHFVVEKDKRSFKNSLYQFNLFTDLMIKTDNPFFIVGSPGNKPGIDKAIKYIGGKKPYQIIEDDKVYLVPTGHRRKK